MNTCKPQHRTGNGPPSDDLGAVADRYTDLDTDEVYTKRKLGWTNIGRLEVHPTMRQKGAWVRAANASGRNLEQWVLRALDKAAR